MAANFYLKKSTNGKFYFSLKAANGEIIHEPQRVRKCGPYLYPLRCAPSPFWVKIR